LNVLTTFFYGTTKISSAFNAINYGVHVMNFEIKVENVNDEEEVGMPQMPSSPKR
jgi:hypothetical protein